jgi:hypothetical protein
MTEAQYTSKVVAYLKNAGTVTFKHSDHFTTGIPDISSTNWDHTTWMEVKIVNEGQTIFNRVTQQDKVQFFTMVALGNLGRAFYIVKKSTEVFIIRPATFVHMFEAEDRSDGYIRDRSQFVGSLTNHEVLESVFRRNFSAIILPTDYSTIFNLTKMGKI